MSEPLQIGPGQLYWNDSPIPIGRADGLRIDGLTTEEIARLNHAFATVLVPAVRNVTATFIGLRPFFQQLARTLPDSDEMFRWQRRLERQRQGQKVFYRRRFGRSMRGK